MTLRLARTLGPALLLGVAVWLVMAVAASPSVPPAAAGERIEAGANAAWSRDLEPVVVSGDRFPAFSGAAIHDLFVYALVGGAWQQIPSQIDEVDTSGAYATENGLLDANDELVFMAMDLGEAAPGDWIANADAQAHSRYQVRVTNPLNPAEQGWVYVYRSATLSPSAADYVDWDAVNNRVVAVTYTAGYTPTGHTGMDSLELNGTGVDVLDRTKLRMPVTCYSGGEPIEEKTVTEDDVAAEWDITPSIDGAVRVGGGSSEAYLWSYASFYESQAVLDLDAIPIDPCDELDIHSMRISTDWRDPAASGMAPAKYYDDNTPGGVTINGSPDSVATTPVNEWKQTSGGRGTVVEVQDLSVGGGTVSNYYEDNDYHLANPPYEPVPTGDGKQYGDAGFMVDNPSGVINFHTASFVLGAGEPNVGATYRSYYDNPLQVSIAAQVCRAVGVSFTYKPWPVYQGEPTTFTASVQDGVQPFSYTWSFGDGNSGAGNPASHAYGGTGVYAVAVRVTNLCGTTEETRKIVVHAPGQAPVVYLPLIVRSNQ